MISWRLLPAFATLLLVGACNRQGEADDGSVPAPAAPEAAQPVVESAAIVRPLSRRDVLLAVAEAQSSYAAATNDGEQQAALDGRPFSFRIRLCGTLNDDFQASFDEKERVLRVAVRPNLTGATLREQKLFAGDWESAEGFWVPRPWLLEPVCPSGRAAPLPAADGSAGPAVPIPSTTGIAQFGSPDRAQSILRGDRAYEITRKLEESASPDPIDLVLEGRLRRLPDGKVINCAGDATLQRPTCIVSAEFDKVRLEQPGGETLAEWSES